MEDSKKIKVVNRTNGTVGYTIPDMQNLHRNYSGREEKIITFEQLRKLSYVPGGQEMLKNYLVIKDEQAIKELNMNIEPEYFYTEQDVIRIMNEGSMDEFLDCLDFAPDGVLDLIKDLSVALPLNDVAKRQAISEKLKFNVNNAIQMMKEDKEVEERSNATRRVAVPSKGSSNQTTQQPSSGRRVVKS